MKHEKPKFDPITGEDYLEVLFDRAQSRLQEIGRLQSVIESKDRELAELREALKKFVELVENAPHSRFCNQWIGETGNLIVPCDCWKQNVTKLKGEL